MANLQPFRGFPLQSTPPVTGGVALIGGMPTAMSFRPNQPVIPDADPITPGTQTTPGVVTATGPSRLVPGSSGLGSGVTIPAITTRPVGGIVGAPIGRPIVGMPGAGIARVGGVVDADPITPGIQTRPGVVTPVGAPRVVSGPRVSGIVGLPGLPTSTRTLPMGLPLGGRIPSVIGGINSSGLIGGGISSGIAGAIVDADPITPGIQTQPGVVTPVGPPQVISGPNVVPQINNTITQGIADGIGGLVDADPITPGIQAHPGTITQTGPSTVLSSGIANSGTFNSGFVGGGMLTSGVFSGPPVINGITPAPMLTSGVMNSSIRRGNNLGPIIDADPFTPGIQLQPGVFTATGPSTVLTSGIQTSFPIGNYDADPITPGIQAQPGTVTITGPTTIVGRNDGFNTVGGINTIQQSFGRGVDADPITPGIQAQPGLVTPVGVPAVLQGGYPNNWWNNCPWWVWPVLGLLLLTVLIGGLFSLFRPKRRNDIDEDD